ncbi:hypothetical protein B296_00026691 [Ensete ventricosum]|uniref:Uncharacterized protein n=1 Tax=Ensete ventricosum TaxID=4639 RepID=A0A427A1V4_ENSVE|nr:hypothetical protein B296_00026691 [Ensete ventricosum]
MILFAVGHAAAELTMGAADDEERGHGYLCRWRLLHTAGSDGNLLLFDSKKRACSKQAALIPCGHHFQMALFDWVHDAGQLIIIMGYQIANLQQEIKALKLRGGPEAVATAEERAANLEREVEKLKAERDEALQWLEAFDKELNDARGVKATERIMSQSA